MPLSACAFLLSTAQALSDLVDEAQHGVGVFSKPRKRSVEHIGEALENFLYFFYTWLFAAMDEPLSKRIELLGDALETDLV